MKDVSLMTDEEAFYHIKLLYPGSAAIAGQCACVPDSNETLKKFQESHNEELKIAFSRCSENVKRALEHDRKINNNIVLNTLFGVLAERLKASVC